MPADQFEIWATRPSSRWKQVFAAFCAYGLLSILMTWPVILHFSTAIVGTGEDDQQFLWNYWWIKHAIMDLKAPPFFSDYLFFPHRTNLLMDTLVYLNGIISIPFQYIMPLPAVYNLLVLLAFVLSGLGTYLLAHRIVKDWKAAFAAGLMFASFRNYFIVLGWVNIFSTQWVPFYLLFLLKALDDEKWLVSSLVAGVLLVFNFYTDYYHFFAVCVFTLMAILFFQGAKAGRPKELAKRLLLALAVALPFILPEVLRVLRAPEYHLTKHELSNTWIYKNYADLAGFFSPYLSNPVIGKFSFQGIFGEGEHYSYLGLTAVCFAAYSFFKCQRVGQYRFWAVSALVFLLLSLGPYPHFLGRQIPIPLPFKLFTLNGFLSNFRAPVRFCIYAVLAITLLAAVGMEKAFEKRLSYSP